MLASVIERVERQRAKARRASSERLVEEEEGCDSGIEGCVGRLFVVLIVGPCTVGVCVFVEWYVAGGKRRKERKEKEKIRLWPWTRKGWDGHRGVRYQVRVSSSKRRGK